jgi:hypothetical protein
VLIDYLRAGLHAEWVLGGYGTIIRFISAVVLLELRLDSDTSERKRTVDRLQQAFHSGRILGVTPAVLDQAGKTFRAMHGDASGLPDRLGPINDVLIALTARDRSRCCNEQCTRVSPHCLKVHGLRIVAPNV